MEPEALVVIEAHPFGRYDRSTLQNRTSEHIATGLAFSADIFFWLLVELERKLAKSVFGAMKSTEKKATAGMIRFVVAILLIALVIVAFYLSLLTPGEA